MGLAIQNILYQVGQDVLGTKLDEDAAPLGIDGLDLVLKSHRFQDMVSQTLPDRFGVRGVCLTGGVRVDRDAGFVEFHFPYRFGKRLLGVSNQLCVEGCRHGQCHDRVSFFNQHLLYGRNGGFGSGQHHLVVGIPVCQGDLGESL